MSTPMRFDSEHPGTRSPYHGRHRKALQILPGWRLARRGAELPADQAAAGNLPAGDPDLAVLPDGSQDLTLLR
jgi:hypothetical protein